jgi:hypothetical protein
METRAEQQTASDLSYYTGGDKNASRSQAIDDLASKYFNDGVGGSFTDRRKMAEDHFNTLDQAKLEGVNSQGNRTGPGSSGGSGAGQAKPKDPQADILGEIRKLVDTICNERLPIQVLA